MNIIQTQDEVLVLDGTLKLQYPTYKGMPCQSWGKWVFEIRELKNKNRIWLNCFDMPDMASRYYDVTTFHLKEKKHTLLNFPELIYDIPQPISLSLRHI